MSKEALRAFQALPTQEEVIQRIYLVELKLTTLEQENIKLRRELLDVESRLAARVGTLEAALTTATFGEQS